MARKTRKQVEEDKVRFVVNFCAKCWKETGSIRTKWEDNFIQFDKGSSHELKDEWQSKLSLKKLETRVRGAAGQCRGQLINNPDWFDLDPVNPQNSELSSLAPTFKKLVRYYLDAGKFSQRASTFLLLAYLSMGSMMVGWTRRKLKNPAYVEWKFKQQLKSKGSEDFSDSTNSPVRDSLALDDPESIRQSLGSAARAFNQLLSTEDDTLADLEDPEPEQYISVGGLDFKIPNPQNVYWDTNVNYINDSRGFAFDEYIHEWELYELAEKKFFDKKKLKDIPGTLPEPTLSLDEKIFRKKDTSVEEDRIKLTWYFGPLVQEDSKGNPKVVQTDWACIIANESVIVKEWEVYPFIEPANHAEHPLVSAAVKEIPFRPTGAGIGDHAVKLDRQVDSNINLMNDQMRLNTIGFGIANYHALVDKDVVNNGISPGMMIRSRVSPKDTYQHISLTSNVERQWDPVNQTINDSIDEQTGISKLALGGPTQRSRTTAREIEAVESGAEQSVNNVAIDLEQTFLVPVLQKVFYRILQFGLDEVRSNPELQDILTQTEIDMLGQVRKEERLGKFAFAFQFKIKGFSAASTSQQRISKLLELLTVINQSGPTAQMVDTRPLLEAVMKEMDLAEYLSKAMIPLSEADKIIAENQLLAMGAIIQPRPEENHEMHIESHLQDPNPTPEKRQHVQMHQQILQMIQEQQQMAQQPGGQPPLPQ